MLAALTFVHVLISLVAIATGVVVVYGMVSGQRMNGWTATFLSSTVATSVTGFIFPFERFLPSHAVGILSLIVLAAAIAARYRYHLLGGARAIYVICSLVALYFNVFVLVAQLFQKVPFLRAYAPTQSEPPFLGSQLTVLMLFLAIGFMANRRFRDTIPRTV